MALNQRASKIKKKLFFSPYFIVFIRFYHHKFSGCQSNKYSYLFYYFNFDHTPLIMSQDVHQNYYIIMHFSSIVFNFIFPSIFHTQIELLYFKFVPSTWYWFHISQIIFNLNESTLQKAVYLRHIYIYIYSQFIIYEHFQWISIRFYRNTLSFILGLQWVLFSCLVWYAF